MSKIQEFLKNQEKSVMSIVEGKTIIDYLNTNAEESPDYPALNTPINNEYTGWDSISWSEYQETVHNLASGLIDIGIQVEDNAFIVANNVKEHFISDLGIMHAGAVPSTIYKQLKSGQIEYISNLLEAKVAFVGDAELFTEVNKAKDYCPDMKYIIMIEDFDQYKDLEFFQKVQVYTDNLWEEFVEKGFVVCPISNHRFEKSKLDNMKPQKLLNYLLQNLETSMNVRILWDIFKSLKGRNTKLVLYTYDSFLFDFDDSEIDLIDEIKKIISNYKLQTKISYGDTYNFK